MATTAQLDNAKALVLLIDNETDEKIKAEMYRAYPGIITVARYILSGEVRTINGAFADDLLTALAEFRTLSAHKTWQHPGNDIPAFVTTDDEGFLTADSVLIVGGIHKVAMIADGDPKRYVGRPAKQSRLRLATALREMGFRADLAVGADEMMRFQDGDGIAEETGYRFTVRHARA